MCVCVSSHAHVRLSTACIWRPNIDSGYIPRSLLPSLWTVSSPNRLDQLASKTLLTPPPLRWDGSAHKGALLRGGCWSSNSGASTFYHLTCLFSHQACSFSNQQNHYFPLAQYMTYFKVSLKDFFSNTIDWHFVTFPPVISSSGLSYDISSFLFMVISSPVHCQS